MSKSLLQRLYDGEIYPAENLYLKGAKHKELNRKISDETEYFKNVLSPEDWKRFETLGDMQHERTDDYYYANFLYGFRLGAGLIAEALAADAEPPKE